MSYARMLARTKCGGMGWAPLLQSRQTMKPHDLQIQLQPPRRSNEPSLPRSIAGSQRGCKSQAVLLERVCVCMRVCVCVCVCVCV